jgi:major membrane immunogen (membrane-anchored lipoprotein)
MNLFIFEINFHTKSKTPVMKKALIAFAMVATLLLSACGGGKPNLDDPKAIAKFNCDKMKEMMELMKDPVANASKIEGIAKEMEEFENEFEKHHGDKAEEMEDKVEESLKEVCADLADTF